MYWVVWDYNVVMVESGNIAAVAEQIVEGNVVVAVDVANHYNNFHH